MTESDVERYLEFGFSAELERDLRFERALSRRCLYAIGIVIVVLVARAMWFV